MENPIKMEDWGVPTFQETSIYQPALQCTQNHMSRACRFQCGKIHHGPSSIRLVVRQRCGASEGPNDLKTSVGQGMPWGTRWGNGGPPSLDGITWGLNMSQLFSDNRAPPKLNLRCSNKSCKRYGAALELACWECIVFCVMSHVPKISSETRAYIDWETSRNKNCWRHTVDGQICATRG